jgi:hypothetical protein
MRKLQSSARVLERVSGMLACASMVRVAQATRLVGFSENTKKLEAEVLECRSVTRFGELSPFWSQRIHRFKAAALAPKIRKRSIHHSDICLTASF